MKKQYYVIFLSIFLTIGVVGLIVVASPKDPVGNKQESQAESQNNLPTQDQFIQPISETIKPAYAAGTFYPKEPAVLNSQLEKYLAMADKVQNGKKPRMIVMPHAGIQYCGETSAWSVKQLSGEKYSKVIILGVSHKYSYDYAAVFAEGAWETPLGKIKIDSFTASKLMSEKYKILPDQSKHQEDHNLEVPLTYIQSVLNNNFEIVPIMIGNKATDETNDFLAFKIASIIDDETLIIISTDLSHYPNWEDAKEGDRRVIDAIVTGNQAEFKRAVKVNAQHKYLNHDTSACGFNAINVGLKISEILEFEEIKELHSSNSGDVTGDKDRVVGYTSIVFWSEDIPIISLNEKSKKEALKMARKTIEQHLTGGELKYTPANSDLLQPIGAFVTLTKDSELRGCIGNFEPEDPVYKVIQNVAISAATKDTRFSPVTQSELENIDIEISTMSPQKIISNWENIELGKHGVRIVLNGRSGTLLPKVATDNNWDLETFLETICWQKMGLQDKQCYKNPNAQIYVYETDVFSESDFE